MRRQKLRITRQKTIAEQPRRQDEDPIVLALDRHIERLRQELDDERARRDGERSRHADELEALLRSSIQDRDRWRGPAQSRASWSWPWRRSA